MRYSKQREALLTLIRSTRSHPSADWLYENLKKEIPELSLGTVYRNLSLLCETGEIMKIKTDSNKEHFDGFVDSHHHFVCRKCDRIYDIYLNDTEDLENRAAEQIGAEVESSSLVFYGVCKNCK